jgi:flagellar basal body-associated protein FliL
MFKNKHIIIALIVTPILAVIAYVAVDFFVSERPQQAESGGQYQLVQLPNCRYASGQCGLKNGNFKLIVTGVADSGGLVLKVESVFSLDEASVSVVKDPVETVGPKAMLPVTADGKEWRVNLVVIDPDKQYLRLAVTVEDAVYYAETAMPFLHYETSFKKDFRPQN